MSAPAKTKPTSSGTLRHWFAAPGIRQGLEAALAGYMDAESFIAQMLISMESDAISPCTPESKFAAAHQCAALGLLPSLSQVALIPRNMKERGLCCTVMPQWQGYQAMMLRHPDVASVKAVLVHSNDEYRYNPADESIMHTFDPFDSSRRFADLDDVRGGYLVVKYKDNRPPLYHYVTTETIGKARACAAGGDIWKRWFYEQCLKTVYRNAYARRVVPIDHLVHSRMQSLVEADDELLENDPGRVVVVDPAPAAVISQKPSRADQASQALANRQRKPVEAATSEPEPEPEQSPPAEDQPKTSKRPSLSEMVKRVSAVKRHAEMADLLNELESYSLTQEEMEAVQAAVEAQGPKLR